MTNLKWLFVFCLFIVNVQMHAQQGTISGVVLDDETGETLIGVAVVIDGTTTGAATDFDGKFAIKVAPGVYNLTAAFISYAKLPLTGVEVKADEITDLGEIRLKSASEMLQEFVVEAKIVKNTEAAMVTMQKNASSVMDGISAASFKKIGDSDAASAVTRVTGVSVQGGKYVYVRGLGDRYTKTTLNGMDIPGLDPDRNSVQMDIFPTNIIDNIVVSKSFTADLPADFTGGAVNIELKDFPDKKMMSAGVSAAYNPSMHFNSDYVTYDGGKTDFLGFDDGSREIPTGGKEEDVATYSDFFKNPNSDKGMEYQNNLKSFDKQMGGYRSNSGMNGGVNFTFANNLKKEDKYDLGYSFAMNYQNNTEYYEDAEFNLYGKPSGAKEYELTPLQTQKGDFGVNNVLLGGTAGLALKTEKHKIRLNLLHLQNGESQAGIFDYTATDVGTTFLAKQYNLQYSERSLSNILLNGNHEIGTRGWSVDWKFAPTFSKMDDPDIRFMRFQVDERTGEIKGRITTEVGLPERIWRFLDEKNYSSRIDFNKDYELFGEDAKLKIGAKHTYKVRNYNIQRFQINPGKDLALNGDPNELFNDENLASENNVQGVYHNPTFIPRNPNKYLSDVNHFGAYISNEFKMTKKLKTIAGVRLESFIQNYTGTNQTGDIVLNDDEVLNDLNLFPTVNFVYEVNDKQNVRLSYAKTIARPSFKEMSYAEIIDPISGRTFGGGLFSETNSITNETYWDGNLRSTLINNFDIRWEMFHGIGQSVSLSGFYKQFDAPIEIVQYLSDPGLFQARNVGDANVYGIEFELRQSLKKLSEKLEKFTFNTNITYTISEISMSPSELQSRRNAAKEGESIKATRAMAGQAPYVVNVGLSYKDKEKGLVGNISYNVQGQTLEYVGFGNRTDVYSVPFHNLSMKLGKAFGKDQKMNLSFKASNLLNDDKVKVFKAYQAQDQILSRLLPQRTFGLSFSYNFF